jgi:NADPH:quinone reductase-like Zn-dependent oxidoreductase
MRALRYDRFGPPEVLHVVDLPEPVPQAGEVKVRVHAASLNPLDWKLRAGHLRWLPVFRQPPRTLGCDFAGEIVGVGAGARSHYVGERVFGSLLPFGRDGALAEYLVAGVDRLATMPDDLGFDQAAALPVAAGTALQAVVDEAHLGAGQRILITGAAGGVGHFAVQIAKHLGANVVAVCGAANADFVRGLGADEIVDYARADFTRRADRFDVVFDAACASSFTAARTVLSAAGCYVNTGGDAAAAVGTAVNALLARFSSRQRAVALVLAGGSARWERLAALAREGVLRAHVERRIALEDVAEAQRAMATGHGRGKIVVQPSLSA